MRLTTKLISELNLKTYKGIYGLSGLLIVEVIDEIQLSRRDYGGVTACLFKKFKMTGNCKTWHTNGTVLLIETLGVGYVMTT